MGRWGARRGRMRMQEHGHAPACGRAGAARGTCACMRPQGIRPPTKGGCQRGLVHARRTHCDAAPHSGARDARRRVHLLQLCAALAQPQAVQQRAQRLEARAAAAGARGGLNRAAQRWQVVRAGAVKIKQHGRRARRQLGQHAGQVPHREDLISAKHVRRCLGAHPCAVPAFALRQTAWGGGDDASGAAGSVGEVRAPRGCGLQTDARAFVSFWLQSLRTSRSGSGTNSRKRWSAPPSAKPLPPPPLLVPLLPAPPPAPRWPARMTATPCCCSPVMYMKSASWRYG